MNDVIEWPHFFLIYVKYSALFVCMFPCRTQNCVDKLTAVMEIPAASLGYTCIHSHLDRRVCVLLQSHAVSVNKREGTHLCSP